MASTSPSAKKSKSASLMSNDQSAVLATVSVVFAIISSNFRAPARIASKSVVVAKVAVSKVIPVTSAVTSCISAAPVAAAKLFTSTSSKVIVPDKFCVVVAAVASLPLSSVNVRPAGVTALPPESRIPVISGASFVPTIVITMSRVAMAPSSSSTWTS